MIGWHINIKFTSYWWFLCKRAQNIRKTLRNLVFKCHTRHDGIAPLPTKNRSCDIGWPYYRPTDIPPPSPTAVSANSDNGQNRCLSTAMSAAYDIYPTRCRTNAMSDQRDVAQGRKRALGERPREISSAQARRQKGYFFRKMENIRKT